MKILWIVNTIFPYPASKMGIEKSVFGGWLEGLFNGIKDNDKIELAIATVYNGKKTIKYCDGKTVYYLLPSCSNIKYTKTTINSWKKIVEEFQPDLVEIHGTEYPYGLAFLDACPDIPSIVVVQGMVGKIEEVYYANISTANILKNITFRDIIKRDTIFNAKRKFKMRSENEKKTIKKADMILGRTQWDYANCKAINPEIKYYKANEILRNSFYEEQWDIEYVERHSVFCSQGTYPIKGLHFAIKAIAILKKSYPDVKLYIAGYDIINKNWIKIDGYAQYLKKLIKKYNVQENIIFTGLLNETQMLNRLKKTNVFVLPSAIENSSNSLGEAMLIGMPCVATNTGGTMDMLEHQKEGLLYPYTEPEMLAEYISKLFENDKLCLEYGASAKRKAEEMYNIENNIKNMLEIYEKIYINK